jgi:hypothetical protein
MRPVHLVRWDRCSGAKPYSGTKAATFARTATCPAAGTTIQSRHPSPLPGKSPCQPPASSPSTHRTPRGPTARLRSPSWTKPCGPIQRVDGVTDPHGLRLSKKFGAVLGCERFHLLGRFLRPTRSQSLRIDEAHAPGAPSRSRVSDVFRDEATFEISLKHHADVERRPRWRPLSHLLLERIHVVPGIANLLAQQPAPNRCHLGTAQHLRTVEVVGFADSVRRRSAQSPWPRQYPGCRLPRCPPGREAWGRCQPS